MTVGLALLLFAVVVGALGGRVLERAEWTRRSPALGIVAWQGLTGAVALSVVLAGAAVAFPDVHLSVGPDRMVHAWLAERARHFSTTDGTLLGGLGVALVGAVAARCVYAWTRVAIPAGRQRREHLRRLLIVAERAASGDYVVVNHDRPLVYCLPGRGGGVVVTRGATHALSAGELAGVLAHEARHLRARHHMALTWFQVLGRAFFGLGAFGAASTSVAELVEMHADDAVTCGRRRDLATALVRVAAATPPAGALAAGPHEALARVVRLSQPRRPLTAWATVPVIGATTALLVIPVLLVLSPTALSVASTCCAG